jgi:hypothetical protein
MFDGKNARARYTTAKAKFGIDLCQMCVAARLAGRFEFACQGCNSTVIGSLEEVKPLLNCFGKAFCASCRTAFFGRWDPLNAAMVMLARRSRRRPPKRDRDPAALCRAYEVERDYCRKVRTLSRRHVMLHTELLNPMGHRLGRAGQSGAYHRIAWQVGGGYGRDHGFQINGSTVMSPQGPHILLPEPETKGP